MRLDEIFKNTLIQSKVNVTRSQHPKYNFEATGDNYDGAPDADSRNKVIGYGNTPEEAEHDYHQQCSQMESQNFDKHLDDTSIFFKDRTGWSETDNETDIDRDTQVNDMIVRLQNRTKWKVTPYKLSGLDGWLINTSTNLFFYGKKEGDLFISYTDDSGKDTWSDEAKYKFGLSELIKLMSSYK